VWSFLLALPSNLGSRLFDALGRSLAPPSLRRFPPPHPAPTQTLCRCTLRHALQTTLLTSKPLPRLRTSPSTTFSSVRPRRLPAHDRLIVFLCVSPWRLPYFKLTSYPMRRRQLIASTRKHSLSHSYSHLGAKYAIYVSYGRMKYAMFVKITLSHLPAHPCSRLPLRFTLIRKLFSARPPNRNCCSSHLLRHNSAPSLMARRSMCGTPSAAYPCSLGKF
jgi:hypothetical protein